MSEDLKPCPFCGGEAEYGKETDEFGVSYHFVGCGCIEGCYASGSTKEEAIKAWNKRHNPWHVGTPTEDGWYLVECQIGNFKFYATDHWNNEVGYWTVNRVIRWQKIEE